MKKKLTREQFIAQFPYKVDVNNIKHLLQKDQDFEGVEVYRALNLLLIKVDDQFYSHA